MQANGTAFRVHKREADVRVLSPVDGEVVETGGAGARLVPASEAGRRARCDMRHLLRGAEVKPWLMRELERLQLALTMEGASRRRLADGGVPVADIAAGLSRRPIGTRSAARCSWSRNYRGISYFLIFS